MNAHTQPNGNGSQQVAVLQPARLPYHNAIKERFGIDAASWKALVEAIYPAAKSTNSVIMALSYCRARNLDPFKKPVHIVPVWDSKSGGYIETVWPGISELRTTAFRTKQYAGCDEAEFGPVTKRTFSGRVKIKQEWQDKSVEVEFPAWCRMTIYRNLGERVCKFVGPKVNWLEAYATIGQSEIPNEMWQSRPEGQLEKCAEAAALRKAFPEELGNELTAEEMAGRAINVEAREDGTKPTSNGPPPPAAVARNDKGPAGPPPVAHPGDIDLVPGETMNAETGEMTWGEPPADDGIPGFLDRRDAPSIQPADVEWLRELAGALSSCEDLVTFGEKQRDVMAPQKGKVGPDAWKQAQQLCNDTFARLQKDT